MNYAKKVLGVYVLLVASLIFITDALFSANVQLVDKFEISQAGAGKAEEELVNPWSFVKTEDQLFFVLDYGTGNIKIYELNGQDLNLIDTIGQKGYGEGELINPACCDYKDSRFVVLDLGLRKIIVYERNGRLGFKRVKDIPCWNGAYDIELKGDVLFISGYTTDSSGNPYDFYSIDLYNGEIRYLLPSHYMHGFKAGSDFGKQFAERQLSTIGFMSWFGIHEDYAFIANENNLRLICLNTASGDIQKTFGEKPIDYVKPYASPKLIEARKLDKIDLIQEEKAKMTYIKDIFVTPQYVLVAYEGPSKPIVRDGESNFRLQFYTLNGDFISQEILPGKIKIQPGDKMWLDFGKKKDILYSLGGETGKSFFILKYEIDKGGYFL